MELLGPSLWDLCKDKEQNLSIEFVAYMAIEALRILEGLHLKGCGPLAGSMPLALHHMCLFQNKLWHAKH